MKRFGTLLLVLVILLCVVGCKETDVLNDTASSTTLPTEETSSKETSVTTTAETTATTSKPTTKNKTTKPSSATTVTSNTTTRSITTKAPTTVPTVNSLSSLPDVKYFKNDGDIQYKDIVNLKNGYAVVGKKETYDRTLSLLRIYDNNSNFQKEYLFDDGNGYEKIARWVSGGFITASYNPPYLTKISDDFRVEWVTAYEDVTLEGIVQDVEQINVGCYVVLYSKTPDRTLKLTFVNGKGEVTDSFELMKSTDISDGDIIPDGEGGFYLVVTCNSDLADKYDLLKTEYRNSKNSEIAVMHFDESKNLTWAKTIGGGGDDWIEEVTVDDNGDFYIAIGTNWQQTDSFWDMSFDEMYPFRRMLVKFNKQGTIVYKMPLSSKGMAVDRVFGIHVKNGLTYVVGMSDYFDGYQEKYPCEQISFYEKEFGRVFCVYTVCIDANGNELDRKIFRCDINNEPCDSTLLPNGDLVIAGSVSSVDNPFELEIPSADSNFAALFVFDGKD